MLKAHRLSKRFGNVSALKELQLSIAAGEIFCLLGANGAGKSTTINLFLGFIEPDEGAALVNGRDVRSHPQKVRADLAYVPEQIHLYPDLSGLENLHFFTRLTGRKMTHKRELRCLFDKVGLNQGAVDARVETYSKGMRQKVGLAIALAKGAKALVLDEPLSGLDPRAASEFCLLLRELAGEGKAILMATHDLFRAREVGHRIGMMKSGVLLEDLAAASLDHQKLERLYLKHMQLDPGHGGGAL